MAQTVALTGVGAFIGGTIGFIAGGLIDPFGGEFVGAAIGASIGGEAGNAISSASAGQATIQTELAQKKADQAQAEAQHQAQLDLANKQRAAQIASLAGNQAEQLKQFKDQQQQDATLENAKLGIQWKALGENRLLAQEQLGAAQTQAAERASAIEASAAARGIKLSGAGNEQTAIYQQGAATILGQQQQKVSAAYGLGSQEITQAGSAFATGQQQALSNMTLAQTQRIAQARQSAAQEAKSGSLAVSQLTARDALSFQHSTVAGAQQESNLWLSAFTSVLGEGASLLGSVWTPKMNYGAGKTNNYGSGFSGGYRGSFGSAF